MRIADLFARKIVYSFEIFPPKPETDIARLYAALGELRDLGPDYVSVTYSAGGSANARTAEIADVVKREFGIEPLAHLTCVNSTRAQVDRALGELARAGVGNVLALRGDRVAGAAGEFRYASELTAHIVARGGFEVAGGCYPEGHPECETRVEDVRNLKKKVDAGARFLNTQLFYDNEDFFRFAEMARLAGIEVPIAAGIMPLVRKSQLERTVAMTGVKIPAKISRMIARFADRPESLMEAGIAYATEQIIDLLSAGVEGIHLYIMNNAYVARKITQNIRGVLADLNAADAGRRRL